MKTDQTYFFPWVRKGLANNISEADVFGNVADNQTLAKMRAVLTIHTQYKSYPALEDGIEQTFIDEKEIGLYGPADVASLSTTAILKRRPEVGSSDFPIQYFPYIEFREADLPWRYTPAQRTEDRLTPWMALLCFRTDKVSIYRDGKGLPILSFRGEKKEFEANFPRMDMLWKTAHAQGPKKTVPTLSRIISLRGADPETGIIPNLDEETEYIACLVPTYEVGRLRGLGESPESLAFIAAQTPAWEDYDTQKGKLRGMEFPVYYSWTFKTGGDSFEGLVEHLKITTSGKAGVTVDVTRMGNGFDYDVLKCKKARKSIVAPAASRPPQSEMPKTFPANNADESKLAKNLKDLISCNPVFLEDAKDIGKKPASPDWGEFHDPFDDPCVTPPVYGARHVLATSLKEEGQEWVADLNLDVNYRIAAGLGRKVVIENQEVLMDRAWKQVEAVQALNMQLYRRLLSIGANNSLRSKTVEGYGEGNKYLASLMFYLSALKEAADRNNQDISLASVLAKRDVPTAFATATFHRMADRVARVVSGLSTKSVLENILEYQTYRFPEHTIQGGNSIEDLRAYSETAFKSIFQEILDKYLYIHVNRTEGYAPSATGGSQHIVSFTPKIEFLPKLVHSGNSLTPLVLSYPSSTSESATSGKGSQGYFLQTSVCPTSPVMWLLLFLGGPTISFGGRTPNKYWADERLALFFETGLDRHNCMGYVYDFSKVAYPTKPTIEDQTLSYGYDKDKVTYYPNMVALPEEKYQRLFGRTMITSFCEEKGIRAMYFANLDELKSRRAAGRLPGDFYAYLKVNSDAHVSGGTRNVIDWLNVRMGEKDSVGPHGNGRINNDSYLADVGKFEDFDYTVTDEQRSKYAENRRRADDYMRTTPNAIRLEVNQIAPEDIQNFQSLEDYREFLRAGAQDELFPFLNMWNQFNELLAQLQPYEAEQEAPAPDAGDADKLKAYMEDDPAYEEALDVIRNYYETFYADDETGRRLQKTYVDELLRSKYPILAYPIFPEPVYYYLKKFSEELVVPGSGDLPMDSVSVFQANSAFVESYLAGMNTEMARELLWREYPTDQRGSYFRKFWDSESSKESIKDDNFFDIKPMHTWSGRLGGNMALGKSGLMIFALKGRLMRLYPTTRIYLWRATYDAKTKKLDYDMKATEANEGIMRPVMETFMNEDLLLVGFKTDFYDVLGNPAKKDYGYFLAFQEDVEDLDFTIENETDLEQADAGKIADKLKNDPTIYGKHLSLFLQ